MVREIGLLSCQNERLHGMLQIDGSNAGIGVRSKKALSSSLNPSRFVRECLPERASYLGAPALDLACGTGRHTIHLSERGFCVTGADLNHSYLTRARKAGPSYSPAAINFVRLDAGRTLPFRDATFEVAIIVHFTRPGLIKEVGRTLRSQGLLVYETFGAHGQNWLQLPNRRELEGELHAAGLEPIWQRFKPAGPQGQVVTAKIFAQKGG